MDNAELEARLGHKFAAPKLLVQALTHRSHSAPHNERLEFLGDSVLNCAVAHLLHERYTKLDEGDLSRLRSNLVKQQTLYEVAQRIELAGYLRLGEGELKSGGFRRPSILADTLEALFGAVFIDGGFLAARAAIAKLYHPIMETVDPQTLGKDAKTLLQEYLQGRKIALPTYNVVATHGAAHNQEFEVECVIPKLEIRVTGAGASRRSAEQQAAKKALELAPKEPAKKTKRTRNVKPLQTTSSAPALLISEAAKDAPKEAAKEAGKETAKDLAKEPPKRVKAEVRESDTVALASGKPDEIKSVKVPAADTAAAKHVYRSVEKAAEKSIEKSVEKSTDKSADRSADKSADKDIGDKSVADKSTVAIKEFKSEVM